MAGPGEAGPGHLAAETAEGPREVAAIAASGLSRTFGATCALDRVDLEVGVGTIHALIGQNGAGKSTCLGIIAGRLRPTDGELEIFGRRISSGNPRAARRAGVAAVYQELTIIPQLTPQANVFLYDPPQRAGLLARRTARARYVDACTSLGIAAAPNASCAGLPVAAQQLIEIVRAVVSDARVLLLDEPTAALSIPEREALFRVLDSVRRQNITTIFVSHNLEEVLAHADVISVFREGRLIETRNRSDWSRDELVSQMLGEKEARELSAAESSPKGESPSDSADPTHVVRPQVVNVSVSNLRLRARLEGVDLTIRGGEVLGVAGLMGSGRTSLLRALAGAEPTASGGLDIDGRVERWPGSVRAARRLGIGLIPEDRKTQGLCLDMSLVDNVALPRLGANARLGYLGRRRAAARIRPLLQSATIDPTRAHSPARTLSGGNQQKLLFARVHYKMPRILLADEPTRGVDIHAKTEILVEMRRLAHEEGLAVVFASSEFDEVIRFSDRILVLSDGHVTADLDNHDRSVTELDLLRAALRATGPVT
jgi:ABC-type sugar transport system ATPase subunit